MPRRLKSSDGAFTHVGHNKNSPAGTGLCWVSEPQGRRFMMAWRLALSAQDMPFST